MANYDIEVFILYGVKELGYNIYILCRPPPGFLLPGRERGGDDISVKEGLKLSKVVVLKCPDYGADPVASALEKVFENLGGIEKYIKPGTRVVLKPNLVMKKRPEDAATTHPALVHALAVMIREAGGRVTIAESPGGLYNEKVLKSVYSGCGMEKAAAEAGASLNYALDQAEVAVPDGKYLKRVTVIRPLVEADLIVNLPKLKTHGQMVYTGAVKNMFGAVPGALKAEFHLRLARYDEFADALIDIFLSVKPQLNIMDAVVGMEGYGPTAGNPKQIGLLLASEDAFALDLAASRIIGADPADIPVIRQAMLRGLCPQSIEEVELVGETLAGSMVEDFELPQLGTLKNIEFFDKGPGRLLVNALKPRPVFHHGACVGCADCAKNCPAHIIRMRNQRPYADLRRCIRCFCCQELCPVKAVAIKRPFVTKLIIKKNKKF